MKIVQKMAIAYKDWLELLPFALLGYHASVHISTGASPILPSSIQHEGRASRGGRSPNNRSSAEIQV
ncbi:hypothetical protein MTR_4g045723 [Medicago truncatula]|uniref:Uncharacterized protein n=1 Tax=Medicago truncatula TaxID=3880 RepID=A0A072UIR2_MEDTR|nr:hypothetical protein MTR_4g045723 [Medicago truncatula]